MKTFQVKALVVATFALLEGSTAFTLNPSISGSRQSTLLYAEEKATAGPLVSGEELELILTDLEQPLVIDAYATWSVYARWFIAVVVFTTVSLSLTVLFPERLFCCRCGPCLIMVRYRDICYRAEIYMGDN